MAKRLERVYLVCGKRDLVPDVYADHGHAISTVMGYIQEDHWAVKLTGEQRSILSKLLDTPELAIAYYNSVADDASKWYVIEQDVRWPEGADDERD